MLKKMLLIGLLSAGLISTAFASDYIPPAHYQDPAKEFNFVKGVVHRTSAAWAEYKLGKYYETGYGTKQDNLQAYVWYKMGVIDKFKPAIIALNNLKEKMTLAQIKTAEQLAYSTQNQLGMEAINDVRNFNHQH